MVGIIVAGHDDFAEALVETAQAILGQQSALSAIKVHAKAQGLAELFADKLQQIKQENEEVLWLVDIFGGTPFHYASQLVLNDPKQHLVTGANLPMILQALANRDEAGEVLAKELETESKMAIRRL